MDTELRSAFRGHGRSRKTRWTVWLMDRLSRIVITICGIGTIAAVGTVFIFLLSVAIPLFFPAELKDQTQTHAPAAATTPLALDVDDDQLLGWALLPGGVVHVFRVDTGEVIDKRSLFDDAMPAFAPLCVSPALAESGQVAGKRFSAKTFMFGGNRGQFRLVKFTFETTYFNTGKLPPGAHPPAAGEVVRHESGVIVPISKDQFRKTQVVIDIPVPGKPMGTQPVAMIDHSRSPQERKVVTLADDNTLLLRTIEEKYIDAIAEFKIVQRGEDAELPFAPPPGKGRPDRLILSSLGDQVFLIWNQGGLTQRIDVRNPDKPRVAETFSLTEDAADLTSLDFLMGKSTLLAGDKQGTVRAWFLSDTSNRNSADGWQMVCGHRFTGTGSPVTALASSTRNRVAVAGYGDGHLRLFGVTAEKELVDTTLAAGQPIAAVQLSPKNDAIYAVSGDQLYRQQLDQRHPEATPKALFSKVWYEGRTGPEYVWESSSGSDAFEPKFSLMPLIFGTLKACLYSLLFGVPLALLAAIYTSEFMSPRYKAIIKPTIELMASLPSVVLGFLAGLVFAQFVERVVPAVLATFATVPFCFILGAYLWQLLPQKMALSLQRFRFAIICLIVPLGLLCGWLLGPVFEWALFGGNLRAWLDGGPGTSVGGWMLLLVPLALLAVAFLMGNFINPWLRKRGRSWDRGTMAWRDLLKLALGVVLTLGLAYGVAWICEGLRLGGESLFDPRSTYLGTYTQRNALVVGFVMGFAIIPIIFTIADDALSAVPAHLRSASLAAGATQWQTTSRIVIPTAMSGLFSAVMIGMGRAIGETMIVVMATGNTPVMDLNVFNGFRTLSANIAVELPEAARDSTHFRTLFLAALVLFAMTFCLNTVAEAIRLRFRRRAYQL